MTDCFLLGELLQFTSYTLLAHRTVTEYDGILAGPYIGSYDRLS